jgi:transposase
MTLPMNNLVDVPDEKGVHIKSAGVKGEKYVYKYTKYFRNAEGKSRNKAISIGKVDADSGKMMPNANYYSMFNVTPQLPEFAESSHWHYGFTYLVNKSAEDMGLWDCLHEVFGNKANEILAVAGYIICCGNSMDYIDSWQENNYIPGLRKRLTSQSCSRFFESLQPQLFDSFFKRWVSIALNNDTVCYDVTSMSSYSKTMVDVEFGYNRDGDDLAQFNIGMFCCETSKIPLYYNRYNGSLNDKSNLAYVLANAQNVGISSVKLLLDGGFHTSSCFKSLACLCKSFTIGISTSLDVSKEIIDENRSSIACYANRLSGQEIFCVQKETSFYGVNGKMLLFFNPKNHAELCSALSDRIELLSMELSTLKKCPVSKQSRYSKYFVITKNESDNGFVFSVNTDAVDKLRKNKGFFILFTTDMEATPEDSLYFYRAKDADEKIFDQIKVDMGCGRARTHNEKTTNGKIFVTFIAVAIRSYMLSRLNKYISAKATSLKKVFNKLENIYFVYSNGKCRFPKALTKEQKDILEYFNAEDDIEKSLDSCIR